MISLSDKQLALIVHAAALLPVEKRALLLERIAARLCLIGRFNTNDVEQGRVVRSFMTVMVSAALLAGCAHQQQYVRTDGAPVDIAQERSVLAQCKGGAANRDRGVGGYEPRQDLLGPEKESAVVNACMARNGYIHPR